jgi:hypothetical protein
MPNRTLTSVFAYSMQLVISRRFAVFRGTDAGPEILRDKGSPISQLED